MEWKECDKKFIRKVSVDNERVESIIEMAMQRLKLVKDISISKETMKHLDVHVDEMKYNFLSVYRCMNELDNVCYMYSAGHMTRFSDLFPVFKDRLSTFSPRIYIKYNFCVKRISYRKCKTCLK